MNIPPDIRNAVGFEHFFTTETIENEKERHRENFSQSFFSRKLKVKSKKSFPKTENRELTTDSKIPNSTHLTKLKGKEGERDGGLGDY